MIKKFFSIFLIGLFCANQCFAEIKWAKYEYFNLAGGLDNGLNEISIADNEASDLQNVIFTQSGSFETRNGFAKINSTTIGASVSCTGLAYYAPTSGSKFLVSIFDNDKIYKMDYSGSSGPDGTWDDITGSLSFAIGQDNLASFAVGEDTLIIEDGINTTAPYKWTGSGNAAALSGSPPNATMVAYHKRMGFAAGNNTNPSTLYYSDVGNIENWTTGLSGNISIETNDGSNIRAIKPGFDALYIWKDNSIWRLSGDDEDSFVLQRMVSDIGTFSGASVGIIGNDFIFQDSQGDYYLYDGAIKVQRISTKIDGTLDEVSFSRFQYSPAIVFDLDYYSSISAIATSTHSIVMLFDTFNQAWSKFSGMNANAFCVADNGTGKDMLVFGDYGGFVYKYPSGTTDAGTSISWSYTTKQYRFSEISPIKDLKLLRVFANEKGNYNLTVEIRNDFESAGTEHTFSLLGTSSVYGTATYGTSRYGGQNLIIGRIEPNEEGNFFQFKFSQTSQPAEIKGFQVFLDPSDRL